MSTRKASLLLAIIFTCTGSLVPAASAQNLVPNGAFTSDIDGWELPIVPNTSITWDAFGNPTGSLRIETTWSNPAPGTGIVVMSSCLQLSPGGHTLRGDVFPQVDSGGCGVNWLTYFTPDCTGNPANSFILSANNGIWETQESQRDVLEGRSYRVALFMQVFSTTSLRSCNFDNVLLTGPRNLDVPTLGTWGLIALAGALAVGGVVLSRRRRLGA